MNPIKYSEVTYPATVSRKYDGIYCEIRGGHAVTRSGARLPNRYVRRHLEILPEGVAGELVVIGSDETRLPFSACQSAFMSVEGAPAFQFYVFKNAPANNQFRTVAHEIVRSERALRAYEAEAVAAGFEGIVVHWDGREGKIKRFSDSEATVIELLEDRNALLVEWRGVEFHLGISAEDLIECDFEVWPGMLAKFKYQPHGTEGAPRFPVFLGFRDALDMPRE